MVEPSERTTRLLVRLDERLAGRPPATCVACGGTQWVLFDKPVFLQAAHVKYGEGYEVLPYACAHCGWLRLHAARTLDPTNELDAPETPDIH